MSTLSHRQPQCKSGRTIAVRHQEGDWCLVEIAEAGKSSDWYFVRPLACDYGAAFEICKQHPDEDRDVAIYCCNIGEPLDPQAVDSSCDCAGWSYRQDCRHVTGLRALVERGQLPLWSGPPKTSKPARSIVELDRDFRPGFDDEPCCGSTDETWDAA